MQYLEPRTDVPAKDDWSTGLILRDMRSAARVFGTIAALAAAGSAVCYFLPDSTGNVVAALVLFMIAFAAGLVSLCSWPQTRARRRGLLEQPWRRMPAVPAQNQNDATDRLLLDGLVLRGWFSELHDMVLERGEVFVCGPNADGRAVVRVAGFAEMHNAKVDKGEYPAQEREDYPVGRPLDDPAVQQAADGLRWGVRSWRWSALFGAIGAAMIVGSFFPLAVGGLVVGGLLLGTALLIFPATVELSRWYRDAVRALRNSGEWTPVAITLFPWKPNQHVAGLAQLPGGLTLVQFVIPDLHVIANIADTGVMWIAGTHDDVITVGVPRVPALSFAVVQPDRDVPEEDPIPWVRRLNQPDFSVLPR